jgi:hypothetical protein
MVSEKTIIVLIIFAVLLTAVSVAVAFSVLNPDRIPDLKNSKFYLPDEDYARVGIVINPQSAG